MNPSLPVEKRVPAVLAELEIRSRRGPGLFPVREAEDFYRLAARHLGFPFGPLEAMADLDASSLEELAAALELLLRQPAEASVWVNQILLQHGGTPLSGIPGDSRREDAGKPHELLALLLRGEDLPKSKACALDR